ncbi:MAG: hypothetical protein ACP5R5_07330, partial [Armatimonadota bacterium]
MKQDRTILHRWRCLIPAALISLALLQPAIAGDMAWFQTTTRQQAGVASPKGGLTLHAAPAGKARNGATLVDLVISLHNNPTGDNDVSTNDDRT